MEVVSDFPPPNCGIAPRARTRESSRSGRDRQPRAKHAVYVCISMHAKRTGAPYGPIPGGAIGIVLGVSGILAPGPLSVHWIHDRLHKYIDHGTGNGIR